MVSEQHVFSGLASGFLVVQLFYSESALDGSLHQHVFTKLS